MGLGGSDRLYGQQEAERQCAAESADGECLQWAPSSALKPRARCRVHLKDALRVQMGQSTDAFLRALKSARTSLGRAAWAAALGDGGGDGGGGGGDSGGTQTSDAGPGGNVTSSLKSSAYTSRAILSVSASR